MQWYWIQHEKNSDNAFIFSIVGVDRDLYDYMKEHINTGVFFQKRANE